MKKKLNDLSLTEKMIVCHGLIQMEQAIIFINWCEIQNDSLSYLSNVFFEFKTLITEEDKFMRLLFDLSKEYKKGI